MSQAAESECIEEPVLFPSKGGVDLYGMIYPAQGEMKGALAVCPPDGDERTWSQRVLVNFARLLAEAGFTVLRFDYRGQGESEGEYEQSTISTRLDDVETAMEFLRKRTGRRQVGLLGLRLGGALAALAASKNASVKYLVLWEPVVDISAYLYNLLRVNISFQMVMHKAVLKNRDKLIEEILSGGRVGINGFYLTQAFFEEGRAIKPDEVVGGFEGKRLVVLTPTTKFPEQGGAEVVRLEFPAIWREPKIYYARPERLMNETITWIKKTDV